MAFVCQIMSVEYVAISMTHRLVMWTQEYLLVLNSKTYQRTGNAQFVEPLKMSLARSIKAEKGN